MRDFVITGGTSGMGLGLASALAARGDRVLVAASGHRGGEVLVEAAKAAGHAARVTFVRADLSTLAGMAEVADRVAGWSRRLSGVVFATQRFQTRRVETADGLEFTFALSYLSRFVLASRLRGLLERDGDGVIVNLAGPGGIPGRIFWDDPQLRRGYRGVRAAMQASRGNDLAAVDFAARFPGVRYVLYNPGFVATGMADPLPVVARAVVRSLARVAATPVDRAIVPILGLLDDSPAGLSVWVRGRRLEVSGRREFDPERAARWRGLTEDVLGRAGFVV